MSNTLKEMKKKKKKEDPYYLNLRLSDTDARMEDLMDLVDYLAVYDAETGLDKLLSDVKSSLDAQSTGM